MALSTRRRPRVVMISGTAPPMLDGVGDYTAALLEELARQRPEWDWVWLTRRPRWFHSPVRKLGRVTMVRPTHTWRGPTVAAAVTALRLLKPDLVHVQEQIHSFFESDAAVRLANALDRPVVTTLHEFHVELPSVVHTEALVKRSDRIIANDIRNGERCLARTGRVPDAQLWSGSNLKPPEAAWGVSPEPGLVTTFGFINGVKTIGAVCEAIRQLKEQGEEGLRWRLVGPFNPETNPDHAELAQRLKHDWIEFTGGFSVRDEALRKLLAQTQIMVLPFADGASPRRSTLQVAWAFGLPIITTPPPVHEPEIIDGENCVLVREQTPEGWSEAIRRLLHDQGLRERLSAGAKRVAERYSWTELAKRHLALYDSARESRRTNQGRDAS